MFHAKSVVIEEPLQEIGLSFACRYDKTHRANAKSLRSLLPS
jgi:hypothetical protein